MTHSVDDSPYAVHNHKEIASILEDLIKHHTAITLETEEGASLVTAVLEVSSDGGYVYMDISPNDKINDQITDSKYVTFATQLGVRVRWYSTHLRLVELTDGNAFELHTPSVIERVQRREYFRLSTPQGSKALICKIPLLDEEGVEQELVEAVIVDMSVGGIGISIKGNPPAVFSRGEMIEGCRISFPVVGLVPVSLKVCGIWSSIKTKSGEQMHHVGMEFVNVSRGAGNVIQRYMIQLESEKISLV